MVTIKLKDDGYERYALGRNTDILGRMYDNDAESIEVIKPENESESICVMIITHDDEVVDHILVENKPISIKNTISQYENVMIGFSFSKSNGYVKNSEVRLFSFLRAQKPDDFVPIEPEQKTNIDNLIGQAIVDIQLTDDYKLNIYDVKENVKRALDLSPFLCKQTDLAQDDINSASFIKNKSTKYLANEGEDGKSKYATESYVDKKMGGITSDGNGNKYLADDGTYKEIRTNRSFSNNWITNKTTLDFIQSILSDEDVTAGMSYLGGVSFSDLPGNLGNAECIVEIIVSTLGENEKVIHLNLYSATNKPYHWSTVYYTRLPDPIWQADVLLEDIPTIDETMSDTSTNPVANNTAKNYIDALLDNRLTKDVSISVEGDNVSLNLEYKNLSTQNNTSETKQLPLATNTKAGLMSMSDYSQIRNNTSRIERLENKTSRLLYSVSETPTASDINSFVIGLNYTQPFSGVAVVVDKTFHIWHYYENDNVGWKDDGQDTTSTFTNDIVGLIKGSQLDGKIFAETDGTGSVYGWDALKTQVQNIENKINSANNQLDSLLGV